MSEIAFDIFPSIFRFAGGVQKNQEDEKSFSQFTTFLCESNTLAIRLVNFSITHLMSFELIFSTLRSLLEISLNMSYFHLLITAILCTLFSELFTLHLSVRSLWIFIFHSFVLFIDIFSLLFVLLLLFEFFFGDSIALIFFVLRFVM